MTDIVERLRADGGSKIEWEAADEIDRLRVLLAEADGLLGDDRAGADALWTIGVTQWQDRLRGRPK